MTVPAPVRAAFPVLLAGLLAGVAVVGALMADARGWARLEVVVAGVVFLAVALVVVAVRGVEDLGIGLLFVAVTTATWNGLSGAAVPVAQPALAAALLVLVGVAVAQRRRLVVPAWVWVLGGAILLIAVTSTFWPTDPGYLSARTRVPVPAEVAAAIPSFEVANLVNAVRWLISAVALPVAVCLAVTSRPRLAERLATAWVIGSTVNAAVAVTDELGVTAISARLVSIVDIGGRQAGLGAQPNHLALAVALVAPVVTWRVLTSVVRWPWIVAGVVLAGGLLSSGSRGGLVAAVLGIGLTVLSLSAGRRVIAPLLGAVACTVAVVWAVFPARVDDLLVALRLSGADSAAESDAVRSQIADQALEDWVYSPVRGIGLPVVADGHNIYLQLLAAGGVLLLLGFATAMVGFALDGRDLAAGGETLATVLVVCTAVWLVVGLVENQLTDAFLYVPFAVVAGLAARRRTRTPVTEQLVRGRGGPS
ncbi:O-antigen ligase family protein [Actinomycetospora sp. CA-101289]|uniref:O-antigen ligase family protein n=1 Tax=Actinomycetospora sp. CA-101289 TaxID=3239893 RepID=UPI003D96518C